MDGMEADNSRAVISFLFKREVMKNESDTEEDLSIAQKNIQNAAKKIQHRTNAQKEKN